VTSDIHGFADAQFARVRDAFAANFEEGLESGAAVAVRVDGEPVADLWAGTASRETGADWAEDTLVPVFSTTKAMAALTIAFLVEQGMLDYGQTVASLWPEFAQNGKETVTVAQALSHQAGLPGITEQMDPADWFDWNAITARLAAQAPMWKLGEGSGYHPVTFGFLAGEIARRASGRSVGTILREEFAQPHGLDLWIGLPDEEHGRAAEMEKPKAIPNFGKVNPEKTAAFLSPWAAPGQRGAPAWRRAEFAGANGHGTARSLAHLMDLLSQKGALDGSQILSASTLGALTEERVRGQDRVLPYIVAFAAGLLRNLPGANKDQAPDWGFYGPSPNAIGHSGWGGSCAFADPDRGVSFSYVMNRQSAHLIGDPRPGRLIAALYESF